MSTKAKNALTMMEILIVIAIVAMLAGGMLFVSNKAKSQADKQLVADTIALLDTALQQYYDYTRTYPPDVNYVGNAANPSRNLQNILSKTGNADNQPSPKPPVGAGSYNSEGASIEVLYYYLNRVPQSRQILSKLAEEVVTNKAVRTDASGYPLKARPTDPNWVIRVEGVTNIPFFRVVDVWNVPLQYIRYRADINVENTSFPLIRSAGPDKKFNTSDDIENRKN
jgi:prepilin-type N-terminal cleavage/methylation domain-containing protein